MRVRRHFTVATVLLTVVSGAALSSAANGSPTVREIVELRTENSRTFELPGIGYRTEVSPAPVSDCHIVDGGYADTSFCDNEFLEIGYATSGVGNVHRRILLKFDLSAIPQTAVVVDADLKLTAVEAAHGPLGFPVQAFRLAQDWTPAATWNNSGAGAWSGGRWGPTQLDRRQLTSALGDWHIYPSRQVQNWVDRSSLNNGLLLKQQDETALLGRMRFASSTNADASKRPVMSVDWRIQGGRKDVNTFVPQSLTDRCGLGANAGTGNLLVRCTEFRVAGVGQDLTLARYYNSTDGEGTLTNADATLGLTRWKLSTGVYLLIRNNQVNFVDGSGAVYPFHRLGSSALNTPAGLDATLEENQPATGQYRLRFHQSSAQYVFKKWNSEFFNWTYQLWKVIDKNQNVIEFSYTTRPGFAEGALAWVKDTRGRTITAGYTRDSASGRDFLTSLTDSTGRTAKYSYSGQSLTTAVDTAGKATTYQYADSGGSPQQLTRIIDPMLTETQLSYDTNGRVTDINRHRTPASTDNTHLTYNDTVSTTAVRDPRANSTVYESQNRDFANRVTKAIDAKGKQRSTSYTSNAKVGSVTNQVGGVTTNTWGANPAIAGDTASGESLTKSVGPVGDTTVLEYPSTSRAACPAGTPSTGNGHQPVCTRNSAGNQTAYTYDGPGNLSENKNHAAAVAKVRHSTPTDGRVLTSTDPRGFVTTYNYTDVTFEGRTTKRLSSITAPAGSGLGTRSVTYDDLDRVRTITTGRSTVATVGYDGADRVESVDYNDSTPDVSYSYDGNGNLIRRSDATGATTYAYNGKNQLTRKETPQGTMTYDYDGVGNLILAAEDGQNTSYAYDSVNQVVTMTEPGGRLTRFAYRADGKRSDTWYNADTADPPTTWAAHIHVDFDNAGRLTRIKTTRASSDADANRVADFSHCYRAFVDSTTPCNSSRDEAADRSKVQWTRNNLTGRVTFYGYDGGERLQTAWPDNGANAYTYRYDPAGNRDVLERSSRAAVHYEYNSGNQLCWSGPTAGSSCASPPAGSDTRYRYDAAGNQVESPELSALAYNGSEQTASATVRGGATTDYSYASDNQVERATVGAATFRNGLLGVQSQTGSGRTSFGRTPDGRLVTLRSPGGDFFYVFDGFGSVVGLVDPAGVQRASYTYGPYGEDATATAHSGALPDNPYRFKGEYLDAATGLYKIGARYYQPGTGRWTQQDNIEHLGDPARGNRYLYVGGDPANRTDPTGFAFWDDWDFGDTPVIGRWVEAGEDLFDEDGDIGDGLTGLAAYAGGKFFGTTICAAAVIGVTGGIGTPGLLGCSAVGSAVGSFTESLAED
jgi:RHS repeat-associated protein